MKKQKNKDSWKILILTLVIVVLAAFFASTFPDGLEFVAEKKGFLHLAKSGACIFSDYSLAWIKQPGISTALAGTVGILLCLVLGSFFSTILNLRKK